MYLGGPAAGHKSVLPGAKTPQCRGGSAGSGHQHPQRTQLPTLQRKTEEERRTGLRHARRLIDDYTGAVLRVAQLAAYTRLFSLWHVLHVPFVFLMVLCAIAHVVAVHAY